MQTSLSFENTMSGLEIDDWSILLAHKRGLTQTPKHKQKFVFGCLCQILFFSLPRQEKGHVFVQEEKKVESHWLLQGKTCGEKKQEKPAKFFPCELAHPKKKTICNSNNISYFVHERKQ